MTTSGHQHKTTIILSEKMHLHFFAFPTPLPEGIYDLGC